MTRFTDDQGIGGDESRSGGGLLAELRGGGDGTLPDAPATGRKKSRLPVQTIVIALVIVASVGALLMMRQYGMNSGLTFRLEKIDYPLDGSRAQSLAESQRVLADLGRSIRPLEIVADDLPQNPFMLEQERALGPDVNPADLEAERLRRDRSSRVKLVTQALDKIELGSLMTGGRVPIARIGNTVVRAGDSIDGGFVIAEITREGVIIATPEGWQYMLRMGQRPEPLDGAPSK